MCSGRFADTEETFEKQWNELSTSIGAIQTQQKVGTSLEQLYKVNIIFQVFHSMIDDQVSHK